MPCLCDVLGKELGGIQVSHHAGGGRPKQLVEPTVPRVGGGGEDAFLIDFDGILTLDEGLPKVKEQKRPSLQAATGIINVATPLAPLQPGNLRRQATYGVIS